VVPVTMTVTEQVLLTAIVPPARLTLGPPPVAVGVPPQVFVSPGVAATVSPGGGVSKNDTPSSGTAFELRLVIVIARLMAPLSGIESAPKALAMRGGSPAAVAETAENARASTVKGSVAIARRATRFMAKRYSGWTQQDTSCRRLLLSMQSSHI